MSDNDNHVFIVGLPRTGTSIMYRTIQKLPGFRPIRLNLMETKIFMKVIPFDIPDLYYPSLLGYFYHDEEIYDQFLNSVKKYTHKLRTRGKNDSYTIEMKDTGNAFKKFENFLNNKLMELKWKRSCKNEIIKQFFTYAKKIRQSKRIVEKTPHHYKHVHQILWTFPNSRIIWMIRHPLDVITSSIKRSQSDEKYINYWNTESFINEFKASFYYYDFYKRLFNENIILIKYEDFVENPANELKKICRFINESFSEDCLTLENHEIPKWNPYSPFIFSKIVNKTDRNWQEYLPMEEGKKIEVALEYLMGKYNFNFYSRE